MKVSEVSETQADNLVHMLDAYAEKGGHHLNINVFNRETLLDAIWGYDNSSDIRTVDVHIRRLREKLERTPASPEHIMTKWGVGYYFKF